MNKRDLDGLTKRTLMSLVIETTTLAETTARISAHVRAMAAEHGIIRDEVAAE